MERQRVTSSTIESVGWEGGVMEVEFSSGRVYRYYSVPEEVYEGMLGAGSVGEYFSAEVRNGPYRTERVS